MGRGEKLQKSCDFQHFLFLFDGFDLIVVFNFDVVLFFLERDCVLF